MLSAEKRKKRKRRKKARKREIKKQKENESRKNRGRERERECAYSTYGAHMESIGRETESATVDKFAFE